MAHALQHTEESQQLALYSRYSRVARARAGAVGVARTAPEPANRRVPPTERPVTAAGPVTAKTTAKPVAAKPVTAQPVTVCAGCRNKEARYGFRDAKAGELRYDRPRTLCFECFRVEIDRRQAVAAQLARGWNAEQAALPLEDTLRDLTRRRRRAQIAARHALELR